FRVEYRHNYRDDWFAFQFLLHFIFNRVYQGLKGALYTRITFFKTIHLLLQHFQGIYFHLPKSWMNLRHLHNVFEPGGSTVPSRVQKNILPIPHIHVVEIPDSGANYIISSIPILVKNFAPVIRPLLIDMVLASLPGYCSRKNYPVSVVA